MPSTCDIPAYFGEGADADFLKLADVVLVIGAEGDGDRKELLAHSQFLSRHCKVLSPLLALADEGSLEPPAKRLRLSPASETVPARLEIKEPLAGYSEAALVSLLTFVYTPGSEEGAGCIKAAAAAEEWDLLAEVVRLADQLDAPVVLRTMERVLLECLPQKTQTVKGWLPLLALADAHYLQLPALYRRVVVEAARAAVASLDTIRGATQLQQFMASKEALKLRQETLLSIMASWASGVRSVQREKGKTVPFAKWEGGDPTLCSSVATPGSYTWTFEPNFALSPGTEQYSPQFEIAGVKWQLWAYPSGQPSAPGSLALFLGACSDRLGAFRTMEFSLSVQSNVPEVAAITRRTQRDTNVGSKGIEWNNFMTHDELRDPAKGFLVDGRVTIVVTIQRLMVLDM